MNRVEEVFGARMREFTTVGIGGPADRLVFPHSVREVQEILASERSAGRDARALGAGSNLLVSDAGVRGTVVCLKKNMGKVLFSAEERAVAEAGVMVPRFSVLCALSALSGAEELGGIPGTVGGALTMNAGAFDREIGELVEWVEIVEATGEIHRIPAREIRFSYREAEYPVGGIIVRAGFRLRPGNSDESFSRMKALNERRRASQPWGERTFGSTFRNPPGMERAASLLERAGMKGAREGDAMFSEKHANFLINRGEATASEVVRLIARGREAVRQLAAVTLATEVKMWGIADE
ncbi:MAG TPA: UDP-N-acetylmuramate dehydrogenase [Candidatus Deferrimicrobiaceae bacterium]|nr:UDP-N-acetylmuramate dehydrogenase [Candidatus Deferrimicrobiaceae bacterium]